jgi:exonuclease SbcC
MRFERLRFRDIGVFRGDHELDLTHVEGTIVALCGGNGAGKTTLLGLLPGAVYRDVPTRGSLADLAHSRESFVEVTVVNGARHTIRQLCDGISKKGETLIVDESGAPVLSSGKVKEADRWVAEHFPAADVLYASSFAVQGCRGFLDLTRAERVRVLNRALGIERLERMAAGAAERAKAAKAQADELRRRIADVPCAELAHLWPALDYAEHQVVRATEAAKAARAAFERGKAAAQDVARAMELGEQRRAVERRLVAARAQERDLEQKIANNQGLLGRADEIRSACAKDKDNRRVLAEQKEAGAKYAANAQAASHAWAVARNALSAPLQSRETADARIARAQARLRDRESVDRAVQEAVEFREAAEREALEAARIESEVERLTELTLVGKDQRIAGLREGLHEIVYPTEADLVACTWAESCLERDDALAVEMARAPEQLAQERTELRRAKERLDACKRQQAKAEQWAARVPEMQTAQADLEEAQADRAAAVEAVQAAEVAFAEAKQALDGAVQTRDQNAAATALTEAAITSLAATVALREHLDRAETLIAERQAALVPVRESIAQAETELAALPDTEDPKAIDIAYLERAVANAEAAEHQAREAVARAKAALEQAQEAHARRAALEADLTGVESELADWTRLAQDLGRDGLQALEIDAAVPELNTITNELLHSCLGTRFTVELRTDRLSADGKKAMEDLTVNVIDTVNGRDADADTYSGGELVLVGSAISLALTTIACRRAGMERPTICLDEAGAALDPENGRAWIAMLRRAAKHMNADKVVFIAHSPELQELADVRIEITHDHRITVGAAA